MTRTSTIIIVCGLGAVLFGTWYILATGQPTLRAPFGEPTIQVSSPKALENFVVHPKPRQLRELAFHNGDGRKIKLADFRGKWVLLNIWATWCAPCRREMPTLDRLQAKLGGPGFEVVALSIDRAGPEIVRKFYGEIGIRNLGFYIDATGKATGTLAIVGLPTTLLINGAGLEVGRLVGPSEWDTPEMVAFLSARLPNSNNQTGRERPR